MALLEELAKKDKLNVDFHNHLQTGSYFRKKSKAFKEKIKNLFLEEGFSNLSEILEKIMKTNLDVIYVTNFEDSRYEDWTSQEQIEIAKKAGYEIEQGDYYTFAKKDERVITLGKSQEINTSQGHVLFVGLKRYKKFSVKKSLDETLKEVDGELKIADHPYAIVQGIFRKDKIKKEIEKFDALEKNGNFYFPFSIANWKALRAGKKYKKSVLSNPDGHHPKDIGKTYNVFDSRDLNYSSERAFRDSINYAVREGNFETRFKPIPPWRIFHHILMIGIYKLIDKLQNIEKKTRIRYLQPQAI